MEPRENNPEHPAAPKHKSKNPDILLQILPIVFHKLKNKLTPILGYAQILKSTSTNPADAARLEKIERGALDFTDLLNKLRDYFQQEKPPARRTSLNVIISGLEADLQKDCSAHDVSFRAELDPSLPDALLHTLELEILIREMVDNALCALQRKGKENGVISITTRTLPDGYELRIRDNGVGVPAEDQDKIWTPFFSTDPERAGLGLVLCEKIISNHRASFTLSTAVGEYAEFAIRFPPPDGR